MRQYFVIWVSKYYVQKVNKSFILHVGDVILTNTMHGEQKVGKKIIVLIRMNM